MGKAKFWESYIHAKNSSLYGRKNGICGEWNEMDFQANLTHEIYNAVKMILMDLFTNKEHYYYITLTTDGGANTPCISAWLYVALHRSSNDEEEQKEIKWSYADSPYCCWKQDDFEKVKALLLSRKNIWTLDSKAFEAEYNLRFEAMETAMGSLDKEGIFNINQKREQVVVLVEVMPPDYTNTERAYRMNDIDSIIFSEWLAEVAESLEEYK